MRQRISVLYIQQITPWGNRDITIQPPCKDESERIANTIAEAAAAAGKLSFNFKHQRRC
jgi:hypothetical protein